MQNLEVGRPEGAPAAAPAECETNSGAESNPGGQKAAPADAVKRRGGAFRRGGTLPTAVCLTKAAIGAGILSMASHCADVGLLYQTIGLCAGAALTAASIALIAEASIDTQCWSYEDICEELFHPGMSLLTGFFNVCNCLGSGAGYLIVCGQVFQVLSGAGAEWRRRFILLMGIFVCAPLALARHVSFMRHLAALSVAALLLLVVTVAWHVAEHGPDETVSLESVWSGMEGATVFTYMNSLNNIVFAYNNQFNVPQLTGELTPEPTPRRMLAVGGIAVVASFSMYMGVSVFGLLAFGVGAHQRDTLVLDLRPERSRPLVAIALCAVLFSVLTCFQFHVYPIRQFAAYATRKVRGRTADDDKTDVAFMGRTLTRWLDVASALSSVAVMVLIAVAVTKLKVVLDFVGAFASAYISFVVPPLWVVQVRRRRDGFSWWTGEVACCGALLGLGIFFMIFGTYSAIQAALEG